MRSELTSTSPVSDRVIATIEEYLTPSWPVATGLTLCPTTTFADLQFDVIDQLCLARIVARRFGVPMPSSLPWPPTVADLIRTVESMLRREQRLNLVRDFFSRTWRPAAAGMHHASGPALVSRLLGMQPRRILDIGCGYNELKQVVPNLIGIDVANPQADLTMDFLRYERDDERFDVILALGSINFGSTEDILAELRHASSMLSEHGRIFMRVNPGIRWSACPELELYAWSRDTIHAHGEAVGLEVDGPIEEEKGQNGPRLAFTYRRRAEPEATRKLELEYRPSSARLICNAWRQRLRPRWRRMRGSATGGRPPPSALLDFATDKIVWLTFTPAMSGNAVARIISASPEMYWDRAVQGIDPLDLRSPHDWHGGKGAATCHFLAPMPQPISMKGAEGVEFTWGPTARQAFLGAFDDVESEVAIRHIDGCFGQPLPFVQISHVPDVEIEAAFPNCRRVALVDKTPETFWVRAFHEKLIYTLWPRELQLRLWRGDSLDSALANSTLSVPLHEGQPITILQKRLGLVLTNAEIRRYYDRLIENDLARATAGQTSLRDTVVVDRSRLFSPSGWQREYEDLCRVLAITPVVDEVGRFIREYNAAQWRRKLPGRRSAAPVVEMA